MSEETITLLGDAGKDAGADAESSPVDTEDALAEDADAEAMPAEALSADEIRERRSLVRRIARYKTVFPQEVSELAAELEGLPYKSPEELASLLEEVQFLVETRRSTAQSRGLFLAGLTMGEAAGPYLGLRLQGLTATAANSDELLRTVDEVALKYEGVIQVDPVARLAMAVGQLALAVDGANRQRELAESTPSAPQAGQTPTPTAETNNITREEFSDL